MIVKAAVKHGGGGLGEDFIASELVQQIESVSTRRSASPPEEPSKWLDGEDGMRFGGLKEYSNNIYRDEAVNTTPNTADYF